MPLGVAASSGIHISICEAAPCRPTGWDSMGIEQFIDNEVKGNDVVLFMKGTPKFPMCGFSGQVVQILDHLVFAYKGINVLESFFFSSRRRHTRFDCDWSSDV